MRITFCRVTKAIVILGIMFAAGQSLFAQSIPRKTSASTTNKSASTVAKNPSSCMDVAVRSVTIELVSTTKNQPGVEFPTDKLKITAVIQDVGPVKANQAFTVKYFKNAQVTSVNIPAPTTAGQSWSLVHSDTYIHDRAHQFLFKIYAPFDQCPNQNNEILINLNDDLLHKNGKQDQSDSSTGISQPSTQPTAPILF